MVNYVSATLDQSLYALSDPTRRAILARISKAETTVTELAQPFDMSLAAVSKHLQVLERAKLVTKVKVGRTITCKANLTPLVEVSELLEELGRYWNMQLDSLEDYLTTHLTNEEEKHEPKKKSGSTDTRRSTSHPRKKRKGV